jgi:hypothetical protein
MDPAVNCTGTIRQMKQHPDAFSGSTSTAAAPNAHRSSPVRSKCITDESTVRC